MPVPTPNNPQQNPTQPTQPTSPPPITANNQSNQAAKPQADGKDATKKDYNIGSKEQSKDPKDPSKDPSKTKDEAAACDSKKPC